MKNLFFKNVEYNKDGTIWKVCNIKSIRGGGRCAISKSEPIVDGDLYYHNKEIYYNDNILPDNAYKVVCVHYWFRNLDLNIKDKIKIEVYKSDDVFKIKYPMVVRKVKKTKNNKK